VTNPRLFAQFQAARQGILKRVFLTYAYFAWFNKIFSCERKGWRWCSCILHVFDMALYLENLWNKYHLRSHYPRCNTRCCKNVHILKYNLDYTKKGLSCSALKTWNGILLSIRELLTLCHFKKQLKMYLMSWK